MANFTEAQNFINQVAPTIVKYSKIYGYPYPSAIIAQAIIESNYGKSKLASKYFNYFGLKCGISWKGPSVNLTTKEEYLPGTLTTIKDNFRVYYSLDAGIKGYFEFIQAKRYSNLKNATSGNDYIDKIKADGYCTSSSYVKSCKSIMVKYDLYIYDYEKELDDPKHNEEVAKEVIKGLWGNGLDRFHRLQAAGYDPKVIQAIVNQKLQGKR